ncbi:MAG: phosphate/phosphite/phosphonate ABC transporter substrate-binding protein [Bacteriovoracaceae bacterium]|nr:phosphate/phosphite/phosphonate ABC transporter substrate-binding protein [Bacteriovoracaceae bacterium]
MNCWAKFRFVCVIVTTVAVITQAEALGPLKITFGVNSTDSPSVVGKKFLPVLSGIENLISKKYQQAVQVRFKVFRTYDDTIKAVSEGKVDFARLGPASYIIAKKQNPNILLLAMGNRKGKKSFKGLIIVKQDSPIKSIADLKGKRFAFGNKVSTIGRYLSQVELVKAGVCAKNLAKYDYLKRHDNVFSAVANGAFDAGALKESTFYKRNKKKNKVRALHSFTNVTKPWIAKEGLDPTTFKKLQWALLNLKDKAALKALKSQGFFPTSHKDYAYIEEAMDKTGEFDNCLASKVE